MGNFNFIGFLEEVRYEKIQNRLQFGRGYTYVSEPSAPIQRIFRLHFTGMQHYLNDDGTLNVEDPWINATTNAMRLDHFYRLRLLHTPFIYPSPRYGNLVCRFDEELVLPTPKPGGGGVLEDFTVVLREQP